LQNEEDIAAVLKEQGISRQDVFITSKVSPYEQGTEKATLACQHILQRLQTDYVVSQAAADWCFHKL
jgi:diketogulonate reductase-like aldo/keto reductase